MVFIKSGLQFTQIFNLSKFNCVNMIQTVVLSLEFMCLTNGGFFPTQYTIQLINVLK